MPRGKSGKHAEILEYALSHLEAERDKIQSTIDAIRQELRIGVSAPVRRNAPKAPASASGEASPRKKRVLSDAARKRIAAAQKRRWAEHRKQQKAAAG